MKRTSIATAVYGTTGTTRHSFGNLISKQDDDGESSGSMAHHGLFAGDQQGHSHRPFHSQLCHPADDEDAEEEEEEDAEETDIPTMLLSTGTDDGKYVQPSNESVLRLGFGNLNLISSQGGHDMVPLYSAASGAGSMSVTSSSTGGVHHGHNHNHGHGHLDGTLGASDANGGGLLSYGSTSADLRAAIVSNWLTDHYEPHENISLPRSVLYDHYLEFCHAQHTEPVNSATFGKIIRSVFPTLRTRRLGTRGNSKYHYFGVGLKSSLLSNDQYSSIYAQYSRPPPARPRHARRASGSTTSSAGLNDLSDGHGIAMSHGLGLGHPSSQQQQLLMLHSTLNGSEQYGHQPAYHMHSQGQSQSHSHSHSHSQQHGDAHATSYGYNHGHNYHGSSYSTGAAASHVYSAAGYGATGPGIAGHEHGATLSRSLGSRGNGRRRRSGAHGRLRSGRGRTFAVAEEDDEDGETRRSGRTEDGLDDDATSEGLMLAAAAAAATGTATNASANAAAGAGPGGAFRTLASPNYDDFAHFLEQICTPVFSNVPVHVLFDNVQAFSLVYQQHVIDLLRAVSSHEFSVVEGLSEMFWMNFPPEMLSCLHCDESLRIVAIADDYLYQVLIHTLIPDVLEPVPIAVTQSIRQFAKFLEGILQRTLQSPLPASIIDIKLDAARRFCQVLRRRTSLSHLTQAVRSILANAEHTTQMLHDWGHIDFAGIRDQADWVLHVVKDGLLPWIESSFRAYLQDGVSLHVWAAWIESIAEQCIAGEQAAGLALEDACTTVTLRWSFYSSMVMRDLTLRSAASFGSFHLVNLLFAEYLLFLVEKKLDDHRRSVGLLAFWPSAAAATEESVATHTTHATHATHMAHSAVPTGHSAMAGGAATAAAGAFAFDDFFRKSAVLGPASSPAPPTIRTGGLAGVASGTDASIGDVGNEGISGPAGVAVASPALFLHGLGTRHQDENSIGASPTTGKTAAAQCALSQLNGPLAHANQRLLNSPYRSTVSAPTAAVPVSPALHPVDADPAVLGFPFQ